MLRDLLTEPTQSTVLIVLPLLFLLSVWVIFRLLLREVYCWYYKINKTVKLLESIDEKLGELVDHNIRDSDDVLSPDENKEVNATNTDIVMKGDNEYPGT
ncbi:hypothetical protein KO465_08910 [Candidatus Micrarchaeota archaeon]|jgi:hypothetical protein|nr:hypothetical protein [Candidatus Micrarchaeota archaeon]